jgi:hypothetical protein
MLLLIAAVRQGYLKAFYAHEWTNISCGEDSAYARQGERLFRRHALNKCMGVRAANENRVKHIWQV